LRKVSPAERIEGGWHDGGLVTRDYFVAEDDNGICYWIFQARPSTREQRENEERDEKDQKPGPQEREEQHEPQAHPEPQWFLHGLFG
jgi:hypothetical protein